MNTQKGMTYDIGYEDLDAHKRESLRAGMATDHWATRFGFTVLSWSRGESAIIVKVPGLGYIAFVVEGLGTKALVAYAMEEIMPGRSFFDHIAQCNFAMAINDLCTVGAQPVVYNQYLAVEHADWLKNPQRTEALVRGTKDACDQAQCVWGGGETPALAGVIQSNAVDLAGASWGVIRKESHLINPVKIRHGDAMVFIGSSGIHANGLSLARKIALKSPNAYESKLSDGMSFGEALLQPTRIYSPLVEACQKAGIRIRYAVNVTGHGHRKFMRATQPFTYVVDKLPSLLPVFEFMQREGHISDEDMYNTLNMGVGFALYVKEADAMRAVSIAEGLGFTAWVGGHIEKGDRKVVLTEKGITFEGSTLNLR